MNEAQYNNMHRRIGVLRREIKRLNLALERYSHLGRMDRMLFKNLNLEVRALRAENEVLRRNLGVQDMGTLQEGGSLGRPIR